MADVDEDQIPQSATGQTEDTDLSDETQDFRFLAAITAGKDEVKIPKRGEKDFEPHATALQSNTLAASRQAMHHALSFQRVHQPKNLTTAFYHAQSNMAYAHNPRGTLFARMGQVLSATEDPLGDDGRRGVRLWLLPEEALYLIERGTIEIRWPPVGDEGDDEAGLGVSMSLQGAYAMFIGDARLSGRGGGLTLERYSVYTGLKRMGYTVLRAPSWDGPGPPAGKECFPPILPTTWRTGLGEMWRRLFVNPPTASLEDQAAGPLVKPSLYRSYAQIYQRLALIPSYDPTASRQPETAAQPDTHPDFRITYHLWKPGSATFKKSAPGPPDFRVAVVNARETDVPTLAQLSSLFEGIPYDPPRENAQLYNKLKNGYKNVILAVVDLGVISYLRISDAGFSREKLYERTARGPGGKRGGGRGGGGRGGRGRGR